MYSIQKTNYIETTYNNKKTEYPKRFCEYIFSNFKKDSKILDVGCGNGDFSKELQQMEFDVFGIDISDYSKKTLKKNFRKVNLEKEKYPFKDNTFDIIFSKSVIEHLREPGFMVDEIFRILKPNGIFICLTPSWKHNYKEQFYIDHTHVTPFTKHSLETICRLSGFEPKCKYFYQLPFVWKKSYMKTFPKLINLLSLPYRPFSNI
jgi:ubiquinone/menaquinone biosynthesis C-methylase UbiE